LPNAELDFLRERALGFLGEGGDADGFGDVGDVVGVPD
jgi:hypothetical protein